MTRTLLAAAVAALLPVLAGAADPAADPAPSIERLDWIAGSWTGTADGVRMEELWLPEAGGVMLGLHRDLRPDGSVFFEYLRIERLDDGAVVYRASPMGRQATTFRATAASAGKVRFENPAHDFPRWIEYRLGPDGRLCARIGGGGDEEDRVEEWCWSRQKSP